MSALPRPAPSANLPPTEEAVAALAKGLAHPARVRIVQLLLERDDCIGGDIVNEIGLAQSTVSEHLRILKAAGIVIGEIERPRICYSLDPGALAPLAALIESIRSKPCPERCD
ncbi:ArsR/SmtB family transcription factor [Lentisalinibacter salinarum]|uniref:ArsR/SmtB family transcription factor n=1 Tax=Lentisalinibacter salinarum TaxID=2992239 RepID=UPI00386D7452